MNEEHLVRTKWGLIIIGILCLAVYVRCSNEKKVPSGKVVNPVIKNSSPARPDSSNGTTRHYVPPEGETEITPKDPSKSIDEIVTIKYKTWGFTNDIGFQLGLVGGYSVGLDYKFFYLGRFGANIGVLGGKNITTYVTPDLTLSYHLDRISWIHNTELFVGYAPTARIPYQMGLRINI